MELLTVSLLVVGMMGLGSLYQERDAAEKLVTPRSTKSHRRVRLDRAKTPQPAYLTLKFTQE